MVPRRTLAVAVLLLVAGCSGLPSDDGRPDRAPYGVDDELEPARADASDDGVELVPGLTSGGVQNASLLVERHYDALEAANGTYVVVIREAETTGNETPFRVARSRYVVASPDRWYRRAELPRRTNAEPTVSESWIEGDDRLVRVAPSDGPVEYRSVARDGSTRPLEQFLRSVAAGATEATVEERTRDGTTLYRVSASPDSDDTGGFQHVAFTVGTDGIVDDVTYAYRFTRGSREASRFESTIEFDAAGPTSLERPDWYGEALEETGNETPNEGAADESTSDASSADESTDEEPDDVGSADEETFDGSSAEDGVVGPVPELSSASERNDDRLRRARTGR